MSATATTAVGAPAGEARGRAGTWAVDAACSVAVVALGTLLALSALGWPPLIGTDDANITQVYGAHLAAGAGFTYRMGAAPVEGSTSLAWTLAYAAMSALRLPVERAMLALGFACSAGAVFLALRLARPAIGPGMTGVLLACLIWLAAQPAYYAWTVISLMDQSAWALALTALAAAVARAVARPQGGGAAMALTAAACVAVRPEAFAMVPVVLALGAAAEARQRTVADAARRFAVPAAAFLAAVAAITLWRLATFGWPLPNTYYAKVGVSALRTLHAGVWYLERYALLDLFTLAGLLAAASGVVLALRGARVRGEWAPGIAAAWVSGGTAFAAIASQLATGGDHFGSFRLLQPSVPLLLPPIALALRALPTLTARPRLRVALAVLGPLLLLQRTEMFAAGNDMRVEFELAAEGREVGTALASLPGPAPVLGVLAAGGIAVTYPGPILDELGLNWARMAHAGRSQRGEPGQLAFTPEVFWSEPPDLLNPILDTASARTTARVVGDMVVGMLKGLPFDTRFQAAYRPVLMHLNGVRVFAFARAGWIGEVTPRLAQGQAIEVLEWNRLLLHPEVLTS